MYMCVLPCSYEWVFGTEMVAAGEHHSYLWYQTAARFLSVLCSYRLVQGHVYHGRSRFGLSTVELNLNLFLSEGTLKKKFVLFWLRLIVKRASPSCLKIEQRYPPDRSLTNGWRGLRTDIYLPDCHLTDGWFYPAFEQLVPGIDH